MCRKGTGAQLSSMPELKQKGWREKSCEMDRIGKKGQEREQINLPIRSGKLVSGIREIKNMRGHIKLFTLQTVPQNAQQTARSRSADRCIYTLGRTESAPSDHMILKAPL